MFAIFARLTRGEARPAREELPDRHGLRSWSAASRPSQGATAGPGPAVAATVGRRAAAVMRPAAARPRRPRLRLLFIGQLMAILAVLGLLIGLGTSMTPAACATQTGVSATAAHSRVVPAACRGGLGK